MNLYRKSYVKNWDHQKPNEKHSITIKKGKMLRGDINPDRVCYIVEEVAYWRKFNALHGFIVDKYADGNDDCKEIYLDGYAIQEILDTLKNIDNKIVDPDSAMPTTPGFFFGSEEYDNYYHEEVKRSIDIFEEAINDKSGDYYYRASW